MNLKGVEISQAFVDKYNNGGGSTSRDTYHMDEATHIEEEWEIFSIMNGKEEVSVISPKGMQCFRSDTLKFFNYC